MAMGHCCDHSGLPLLVCGSPQKFVGTKWQSGLPLCHFCAKRTLFYQAAAGQQAGTTAMLYDDHVLCSACKKFSSFTKRRLMNKTTGIWKCASCNSKGSTLRRHFGRWPLPEFKALSENERVEFMVSTGASNNELIKAVERLSTSERHLEKFALGGEFLPLAAWGVKGFDVSRIESLSKPEDIEDHDVLGKTYRVRVHFKGMEATRGTKRDSDITLHRPDTTAKKQLADRQPQLAIADGRVSQSSSDDSSSSSSSSRKHRRHRRHKKDKKSKKEKKEKKRRYHDRNRRDVPDTTLSPAELKARKALEQVRQREEAKMASNKVKLAQAALVKLETVIASMDDMVDKASFEHVPVVLKEPYVQALKKFKDLTDECHACIEEDGVNATSVDLKELTAVCRFGGHPSGLDNT